MANLTDKFRNFNKQSVMHPIFILEAVRVYCETMDAELAKNPEETKQGIRSSGIEPEDWIEIKEQAKANLLK